MNIPNHVAIILDGNGRWAKSKGMPRNYGHVQGAKNVEVICRAAHNMGIKYLTVYAFSTENWKRPQEEVDALMTLLNQYMKNCQKTAKKNNMRVRVIGDKTGLSEAIQKDIAALEEATKDYDGLNFTIALNYGGRDEIIRAINKVISSKTDKEITENEFSTYLDSAYLPEVDLLIRTSGEQRISNYMLWQLAYAEFIFTPTYWPDFKREHLIECLKEYELRNRRYGGL